MKTIEDAQRCTTNQPDIPLSKNKLVKFLKESHIDLKNADGKMYFYGTGRNIIADLVLVGIAMGEFEFDKEVEEKEPKE